MNKRPFHQPLGQDDQGVRKGGGALHYGEVLPPKEKGTANAEDGYINYGAMRLRDQSHESDHPEMVYQHDSEMEYDT